MTPTTFEQRTLLPVTADEAFAWHAREGAFDRLQPPWEHVKVLERTGGICDGGRVTLEVMVGPLKQKWIAVHDHCIPGREFRDSQEKGPFHSFVHTHRLEPVGNDRAELVDHIEYVLPGGALGSLFGDGMVRERLQRMFRYRHQVTRDDLAQMATYRDRILKRVAVSGTGGLVGSRLCPMLTTQGTEVLRIERPRTNDAEGKTEAVVHWDPSAKTIDGARLESVDAVVHLAGESIVQHWSHEAKDRIRKSRTEGTRFLCETLASLEQKPKVLVCASAVGFYGDRGQEVLNESSTAGAGFLAEVCREWEAACRPAIEAGIRVVNLRFGMILSPRGGALKTMLPIFQTGVGGPIGSGRQYWAWVSLDDVLGNVAHALYHEELQGPVNVVGPQAVTAKEFTTTLGRVLSRPTLLPVPAFATKIALGEIAEEMILAGQHVLPTRLIESDYTFRTPTLEKALRHVLGR